MMLPTDNTKSTNFSLTTEYTKEHKKINFVIFVKSVGKEKNFVIFALSVGKIKNFVFFVLSVGKNKNNPLAKNKLRDIRIIRWQK